MLMGIVLAVFGGLLTFGIAYDFFVRKSFKSSKNKASVDQISNPNMDSRRVDMAARHIDNARVDGAANQMSSQSTGF